MKTINEKEKKLHEALHKLNNIKIENPNLTEEIESLDKKKNQLENEKRD